MLGSHDDIGIAGVFRANLYEMLEERGVGRGFVCTWRGTRSTLWDPVFRMMARRILVYGWAKVCRGQSDLQTEYASKEETAV